MTSCNVIPHQQRGQSNAASQTVTASAGKTRNSALTLIVFSSIYIHWWCRATPGGFRERTACFSQASPFSIQARKRKPRRSPACTGLPFPPPPSSNAAPAALQSGPTRQPAGFPRLALTSAAGSARGWLRGGLVGFKRGIGGDVSPPPPFVRARADALRKEKPTPGWAVLGEGGCHGLGRPEFPTRLASLLPRAGIKDLGQSRATH